jgi:hypothetical protein
MTDGCCSDLKITERLMSEPTLRIENEATTGQERDERVSAAEKPAWETPQMQDVSEEVMAQPYIRFT